MNWLLDDGHLAAYLRTHRRPSGVRRADEIYTTGYWYVRLCQAVLGVARRGALSAPFDRLSPDRYASVLETIVELPADVGLLSLRDLAPTIGRLRLDHDLNVLGSEALAAATTLQSHVLLSAASPRLEAALTTEGLGVSVRNYSSS